MEDATHAWWPCCHRQPLTTVLPTRLWEPHSGRLCTPRDEENGDVRAQHGSRIIINAINKGRKRSWFVIADVGTAATLGNLGVHHKCIPKWVLPNSAASMLAIHTADPNELRAKLRPDIILVELQEHEQTVYQGAASNTTHSALPSSIIGPQLGHGRQRKICIAEGSYCADTRYAENVGEKNELHEKLQDMLKMYGCDVHLRPI